LNKTEKLTVICSIYICTTHSKPYQRTILKW